MLAYVYSSISIKEIGSAGLFRVSRRAMLPLTIPSSLSDVGFDDKAVAEAIERHRIIVSNYRKQFVG